jgi:hypothetical protein
MFIMARRLSGYLAATITVPQESRSAFKGEIVRLTSNSHAHACHNPVNWSLLPNEMLSIVGRVLTDRFWQAGISEGSKDEFYARVLDKRNTMEGLASSIRGTVRFVRETCYAIIYCMSRLDVQFYGFSELPGPLAHALFADSFYLSAHQIINLLNLVKYLVDSCPVQLRDHFLPPLLAACFQQMDAKISSEWDSLGRQREVRAARDELTEEMKTESILRQLTYTAVVMVADFLDPARISKLIMLGDGAPPLVRWLTHQQIHLPTHLGLLRMGSTTPTPPSTHLSASSV